MPTQLVLTQLGGDPTETVRLEQAPDAARGADEALVAIEAATLNPSDFKLAAGQYGVRPTLPTALGTEGVGRVLEAADAALVGRRVLVLPTYEQGTWADRVVVAVRNLVPVPETADPAQLAMLGINPATAYLLLDRYADVGPGDWIGQNLGNSAVGKYVIALARHKGVKTLSVVRRKEAAEQIADGDAVLVDGDDLAERITEALGGAQLRLVLDGTGDGSTGALAHALEFGGTVVSYSSVTGHSPDLSLGDLIYREVVLRGIWLINWIRSAPRDEVARVYGELAALVERGVLHLDVEATYPLERYREAFEHAQRPYGSGKILFRP
jgi:NADPH:quinone reductase-like Zn-dependent oxidoreductase